MAIPLGNIDFTGISVSFTDIGLALSRFVVQGSNQDGLLKSDLSIVAPSEDRRADYTNVLSMVQDGNPLLDSMVYISLNENERPRVPIDATRTTASEIDVNKLSQAVFYVYMFILIRGRAPNKDDTVDAGSAPGFLVNIMHFKSKPIDYCNAIASFDINKLDYRWIKSVSISGLPAKVRNRLSLGIAGYRALAALKVCEIRPDASKDAKDAAQLAIAFYNAGPVWSCVSVTRSEEFINRFGNFNGTIYNLLGDLCTTEHLKVLVDAKVIPSQYKIDPRHNTWKAWKIDTFAGFIDFVFPRS